LQNFRILKSINQKKIQKKGFASFYLVSKIKIRLEY
jgi:hypothetical protein